MRQKAEALALTSSVVEWLNRNPVRSPPGRCLGCGGGNPGHDPMLPYGIEPTGHAWLHSRCWPLWHAGRKAKAVTALAAMGIGASGGRAMEHDRQYPRPQLGPALELGIAAQELAVKPKIK